MACVWELTMYYASLYLSILSSVCTMPKAVRDVFNDWLVSYTGDDSTTASFSVTPIDFRTDTFLYHIGSTLSCKLIYGAKLCKKSKFSSQHEYYYIFWKHACLTMAEYILHLTSDAAVQYERRCQFLEWNRPYFSLHTNRPIKDSRRLEWFESIESVTPLGSISN